MSRPRLHVIVASVRPTRVGRKVADWFLPVAREHGGFEVALVDLRELDLPLMDEPKHPRLADYQHDHTREWSEIVARADAFVFVTPEYDFGPPASLINAMQYLVKEWAYKPAGLVSYGGVSAGLRSANALRILCTANGMMPIPVAVSIPFVAKLVDQETGVFDPGEVQVKASKAMLDELQRWERALRTLREPS